MKMKAPRRTPTTVSSPAGSASAISRPSVATRCAIRSAGMKAGREAGSMALSFATECPAPQVVANTAGNPGRLRVVFDMSKAGGEHGEEDLPDQTERLLDAAMCVARAF